jgi:NADH-quinone oxidoreductase subunit M
MDYSRLLVFTILLPFAGAALVGLLAPTGRHVVRAAALGVAIATFLLACILAANFPSGAAEEFAVASLPWLNDQSFVNVQFSVALDGLSLWLFCLSSLLLISSVLVSWEAIAERPAFYYAMLLLLAGGCMGVFAARDIILFYVFFEFTLIPLFFLIGIWGSEERRYAAIKFFLFTFAGSVLTFLGLLTLVFWAAKGESAGASGLDFSIPRLTAALAAQPMPVGLQVWVFLALFAGFAIKVPLFPLHTWLPLAHVQAPTAGSVFLAGVLLKIGTYGFLRFNIPMLPEATALLAPWLLWLGVIGVIYGAMVALAQSDMKRLIAYSSVSHLGYCMLGLFALNQLGVQGGTLQMVNHGVSTGALFALVGMLYERYHTREIKALGGLARRMPWLAFFFVLFTFSSIGLPGTNGFSGEFPLLAGVFQTARTAPRAWSWQFMAIAVLAVFGVVLGAWYMLWLVQRVFFGPLREPHHEGEGDHPPSQDLSWREIAALAPLAVFVFWIGLWPQFFLDRMAPTLSGATRAARAAVAAEMHYSKEAPVAKAKFIAPPMTNDN